MKLAITLSALVAACSCDAGIYLPHGAGFGGAPYPSHYGYAIDDFPIAPVHVAAAVHPVYHAARLHHAAPVQVAAVNRFAVSPQPIAAAVAPIAAARGAPIVVAAGVRGAVSSQFHSQDEAGNFAFGYQNENSARQESGNIHTGLAGSYTDHRKTTNYVADNHGFRITN